MDALGEHDLVLGPDVMGLVDGVHIRARCVDDDLGLARVGGAGVGVLQGRVPHAVAQFRVVQGDVVGADRAGVERGTHEVEDEAGVVVHDVGVGVLDAAEQVVGAHYRARAS